ncbi:hypothetical protein OS493_004794 [Desmophyllum pertusum]|uniref:U1 small nuclear ribonucleoprotein C n=1 Tax=Desmophyllum pertusum TaxID=174260 RepID=A0A9X0D0G5_9CNID|nr:hypothetical protein OS493_004794 [Desmophyllum pertusum]
MPKYYCDYCDTYLTHDSPSVRKTHNGGRKHKENVRFYYTKWMEEQAQSLIDQTTAAYQAGTSAPPAQVPHMPPPGMSGMLPPPPHGMMPPPPGALPPLELYHFICRLLERCHHQGCDHLPECHSTGVHQEGCCLGRLQEGINHDQFLENLDETVT